MAMTEPDRHVFAATEDAERDLDEPIVVDADEFSRAAREKRWREFCLNADEYVARTTRPAPRAEQPA